MKDYIEKTKGVLLILAGATFIIAGIVEGSGLMITYSFWSGALVSIVLGGIGGVLIGQALVELGII